MRKSALAPLAAAGLFGAAVAWALNQQLAYIIASWACGRQVPALWIVSLVAVAIVALGGVLSWQVVKNPPDEGEAQSPFHGPRRFLSQVSLMAVLLFLFAILLQAAAAFFLPGCRG